MEEIHSIEQKMNDGENPVDFKKRLAYEIVKQLHSDKDAESAEGEFKKRVQDKELPTVLPTVEYIMQEESLENALVTLLIVTTKSEAKRLIEQGGVSLNDLKLTDPNAQFSPNDNDILKIGKRKIFKIELKS